MAEPKRDDERWLRVWIERLPGDDYDFEYIGYHGKRVLASTSVLAQQLYDEPPMSDLDQAIVEAAEALVKYAESKYLSADDDIDPLGWPDEQLGAKVAAAVRAKREALAPKTAEEVAKAFFDQPGHKLPAPAGYESLIANGVVDALRNAGFLRVVPE